MNYFLFVLLLVYVFLFILYIKQHKRLKFLVALMPNKKFYIKNGEEHPLTGKPFPFFSEFLTEDVTIALLTSPTCSACMGSFEQAVNIVNQYNLDFLHLVVSNNKSDQILVEQKEIQEIRGKYYQLNIPHNILSSYNLLQYPQYIIIKNKIIVEFAGIARRIEYLMENNLLDNNIIVREINK
ncbi:hypothetical protein B4065_3148 [Caldibacillus thermoamylovorans]|uniref:hypothetical protein n=2 Tax=Caldibacillus thermoamylovorans TaxID=35841 RepID=UPI0005A493CC|nr:hypothetical protein [Caldibacillus thermoamylovorans]KIO62419.1 hypothetical protein B4065_3148 [Caldibacillus thermoamylovorans]